jgi:hypothetical protein
MSDIRLKQGDLLTFVAISGGGDSRFRTIPRHFNEKMRF